MAKKIYYIGDTPYRVDEEKEKDFLEKNKDKEPKLKYAGSGNTFVDLDSGQIKTEKEILGNQQGSTAGATAEQTTSAPNQEINQSQTTQANSAWA